jgi:hypothetical protein
MELMRCVDFEAPKPAPKSTQKPTKNQEIDDQLTALSHVVEKLIMEKENLVQMNRYFLHLLYYYYHCVFILFCFIYLLLLCCRLVSRLIN